MKWLIYMAIAGVSCSSPLAAQTTEQVKAGPSIEQHQQLKERREAYKERLAAKKALKRQHTVEKIKKRGIKQ
jgi:hypothetical protein